MKNNWRSLSFTCSGEIPLVIRPHWVVWDQMQRKLPDMDHLYIKFLKRASIYCSLMTKGFCTSKKFLRDSKQTKLTEIYIIIWTLFTTYLFYLKNFLNLWFGLSIIPTCYEMVVGLTLSNLVKVIQCFWFQNKYVEISRSKAQVKARYFQGDYRAPLWLNHY